MFYDLWYRYCEFLLSLSTNFSTLKGSLVFDVLGIETFIFAQTWFEKVLSVQEGEYGGHVSFPTVKNGRHICKKYSVYRQTDVGSQIFFTLYKRQKDLASASVPHKDKHKMFALSCHVREGKS